MPREEIESLKDRIDALEKAEAVRVKEALARAEEDGEETLDDGAHFLGK